MPKVRIKCEVLPKSFPGVRCARIVSIRTVQDEEIIDISYRKLGPQHRAPGYQGITFLKVEVIENGDASCLIEVQDGDGYGPPLLWWVPASILVRPTRPSGGFFLFPGMKNEMRLGFDLDDVIIDHTKNKQNVAKRLGFLLEPKNTAVPRLGKIIPKKIYRSLREETYGALSLFAPPVPGVKKIIMSLKEKGHQIIIISRRYPENRRVALDWLKKERLNHLPSFFVDSDKDKLKLSLKNRLELYIDNDPRIVALFQNQIPFPVLFDRFNVAFESGFKGLKVKSHADFRNLLERLELSRRDQQR